VVQTLSVCVLVDFWLRMYSCSIADLLDRGCVVGRGVGNRYSLGRGFFLSPLARRSGVLHVFDGNVLIAMTSNHDGDGANRLKTAVAVKWTLILGPGVKLENGRSV
jgi:hypothetical protein